MHSLTFVKGQECTLEQFLNGPLYDPNFDTSGLAATYSGGKQVRVGCNVGFSGFFKLVCIEGKWESRGTICNPKSCGHPGDTQNADFQLEKGEDFVFGSQVKYTCHKGYQMVSRTNYRRCMAEGWDGNIPVCEAQQCPIINVDDHEVQVNGDIEEATFGNVVRFSCKSSSKVLFGSTEMYCDENGEWVGDSPKCKEIICTAPEIENGDVLGQIQEYKEHEVLEFQCKPSFTRAEARSSKCTKQGVRAEWSPTPLCEPITCKLQLPGLKGTSYEPAYRNTFSPGDEVTVNCGEMYWIYRRSSVVTTCKEDGEWTIRPVCQEVTCSKQGVPHVSWDNRWPQTFKEGESTRYRCETGYRRKDGASSATCTRDGWHPNPLCQEIICTAPEIENGHVLGQIQEYKEHQVLEFQCKPSFTRAEARSSKCKNQGVRAEWSPTPLCEPTACSNVSVPHGFVVRPYNDALYYYTCEEGYKLPTKGWWAEARCNDSVLSELKLCIENKKCGDLPVIPNGEVKVARGGERARVICKQGYHTEVSRFSCDDGPLKIICTPIAIPCSPPRKVQNAVVVTPYQKEYLSDSEVTYKCRESYTAVGETTIQCRNGQWGETLITCTPPAQQQ
ncbi:hypothetical protein NQZ68_004886 [Dissostichus eleginoides]|nr:hypothetical protein NQZ68_004886 [Dissostichus eleginoides]